MKLTCPPVFGGTIANNEVSDVWTTWAPAALKNGTLKCKPDPEIVGKGVESIQDAVALAGKGVSAKKLVVDLS